LQQQRSGFRERGPQRRHPLLHLTAAPATPMRTSGPPCADAEMARLVCVKHFKAFPHRSMAYPPQPQVFADVLSSGLVFAK
jgi:hypothetical protein